MARLWRPHPSPQTGSQIPADKPGPPPVLQKAGEFFPGKLKGPQNRDSEGPHQSKSEPAVWSHHRKPWTVVGVYQLPVDTFNTSLWVFCSFVSLKIYSFFSETERDGA